MNYDKIRRGWVWFIENDTEYDGHIQGGSRPWVIVSNDECNKYSSIIHMAPVTSQAKKPMPTHVRFKNDKGFWNTILCEQIKIVNTEDIVGKELYKLPEEILEAVDKAIGIQFGIRYTPVSYKDIETYYSYMESFYRDDFTIKVAQMKKDLESVCKGLISEFDKKISDIAEKKVLECTKNGVPENTIVQSNHNSTQVEKFEKKWGKSADKNGAKPARDVSSKKLAGNSAEEKPVSKETKTGPYKWDIENIRAFFKVYASGGQKEVISVYGLASASIASMKSIFLKKYKASFSTEQKKEYVSDCNNLTVSKVMGKWSMPTKNDVMKFRNEFEVELGV